MPAIYHEGEFLPGDQAIFNIQNRGFKYGDGLFESMAMFSFGIPLLHRHLARLQQGMELLHMEQNGQLGKARLSQIARQLAQHNAIASGNARIRLCVYRLGGGKYTPISDKVGVVLEASPLPNGRFAPNENGLELGVFDQVRCPAGYGLAAFKTANKLQSVLAASHARRQGWDECLLLNQRGYVAEAASSNVFLVEGGKLATPHLSGGCLGGVMRRQVIATARKRKIPVVQAKCITPERALAADELWLTNAVQGVRWAAKFQNRGGYGSRLAKEFAEWLNGDLGLV